MEYELEYCCELEYKIETQCYNDSDCFTSLETFVQSTTTLVELLGGSVIFKEFWKHCEETKFITSVVGYNVSIVFYGQGDSVYKFPFAISLFFEGYDVVKLDQKLHLVKKS